MGGGGHRPRPYFPTHICCHSDDAELAALDFSITPSGRLPALSGSADADRLVVGAEVLRLASFCLVDMDLRLAGADDPAHKARYADVLQAELSFLSRRLGPPRRLGLSA